MKGQRRHEIKSEESHNPRPVNELADPETREAEDMEGTRADQKQRDVDLAPSQTSTLSTMAETRVETTGFEVLRTEEEEVGGSDILSEVARLGMEEGTKDEEVEIKDVKVPDSLSEVAELDAEGMKNEEEVKVPDILLEILELGAEVMRNAELDDELKQIEEDESSDILMKVADLGTEVMRNEELDTCTGYYENPKTKTTTPGSEQTVVTIQMKEEKDEESAAPESVSENESSERVPEGRETTMEGGEIEGGVAGDELGGLEGTEASGGEDFDGMEVDRTGEPIKSQHSDKLEMGESSGLEYIDAGISNNGDSVASADDVGTLKDFDFGVEEDVIDIVKTADQAELEQVPEHQISETVNDAEEMHAEINQVELVTDAESLLPEQNDEVRIGEASTVFETIEVEESEKPATLDHIAKNGIADVQKTIEDTDREFVMKVEGVTDTESIVSEQHNETDIAETLAVFEDTQIEESGIPAILKHVAENALAEVTNTVSTVGGEGFGEKETIMPEQRNEVGIIAMLAEPEYTQDQEHGISGSKEDVDNLESTSEVMQHDLEATQVIQPKVPETVISGPTVQELAIPETKDEIESTKAVEPSPETTPDVESFPEPLPDIEPVPDVEPFPEAFPDIESAPDFEQNPVVGTEVQGSLASEHSESTQSPTNSREIVQVLIGTTEAQMDVIPKLATPEEVVPDPKNELNTAEVIEPSLEQAHVEGTATEKPSIPEHANELEIASTSRDVKENRVESTRVRELDITTEHADEFGNPKQVHDEAADGQELDVQPPDARKHGFTEHANEFQKHEQFNIGDALVRDRGVEDAKSQQPDFPNLEQLHVESAGIHDSGAQQQSDVTDDTNEIENLEHPNTEAFPIYDTNVQEPDRQHEELENLEKSHVKAIRFQDSDVQDPGVTEHAQEGQNSNTTSDPQDNQFESSPSQEPTKPKSILDKRISIVETTFTPWKEVASEPSKRVEASQMTNDRSSTSQDTNNETKNGPTTSTPQRKRANGESAELPVAKDVKLDKENGDAILRQVEGDEPLEMPHKNKKRTHAESDPALAPQRQTPSKRPEGRQPDIIDLSSPLARFPAPLQIVVDEESFVAFGDDNDKDKDDSDDELEFLQSVKHIRKPRGEEKVPNRPGQETVNLADSSEIDLTPSPTTATGDAPDTKAAEEVKDAPKRAVTPWAAQERYNRTKTILYSAPKPAPGPSSPVQQQQQQQQRDQDPSMQISQTHKKSRPPGGTRPVNTLSGNRTNPPYHPPPRPGQTKEQSKNQDFRSPVTGGDIQDGFNIYGSQHGRREQEYQNKRQKTGVPAVIDLEAGAVGASPQIGAYSARSSYTQNTNFRPAARRDGKMGVQEFQLLEKNMESGSRSRNRQGNSSNGQAKDAKMGRASNGSQSKSKHGSVNEDPNDPIQLDSDHDLQRSRAKPQYKGTANLGPARANDKSRLTVNNATKSSHFAPNRHANPNPPRKGRNAQTTRRQFEDDDSMDELSGPAPGPAPYTSSQDRRARNQAKSLLESESSSRNGVESTSSHPRVTHSPHASDDDSQPDPSADIQRIDWETSEELSLKGDKFPLLLVFTQHKDEQWLTEVPKNRWFLLLNHSTKMLSCYNANGSIWDMPLFKIRYVEHNKNSPMMLIVKSADAITKGSRVHLKLQSADASDKLCQSLRKTVNLNNREVEYLEKVFRVATEKARERNQEKLQRAASKPSEDLEIELLINKKQRREDKERSNLRNAKDSHALDVFEIAPVRSQRLIERITEATEPITRNDRSRSTNEEAVNDPNDRRPDKPIHDTRSSNRSRYFARPVVEKARSRTPSPPRWTMMNPGWEKSWRGSVVYPPQGKNKATVDQRDIPRLDYGEFLNDNLIQFQLNWLEQDLLRRYPAAANRVLFMNTFFYERLMQDAKAGKINYKAVERWTSRIDIFSYDYIIVPVNESVHWYLAIICNAPRLINPSPPGPLDEQEQETSIEGPLISQAPALAGPSSVSSDSEMSKNVIGMTLDEGNRQSAHSEETTVPQPGSVKDHATPMISIDTDDTEGVQGGTRRTPAKKSKAKSPSSKNDTTQPKIIILDSLDGTHPRTTSNLRQYLHSEAEAKLGIQITTPKVIGMTARNIDKQDNYWDCGVFLLTYIEEFIKDPDHFIRSLYPRDPDDLTYEDIQWPKPVDQRDKIREQLMILQEEQATERDRKVKDKKARKDEKRTDVVADMLVEAFNTDPHPSADGLPQADKGVKVWKTASPSPDIVDTGMMKNTAKSANAIKPLVQVPAHKSRESPESPSASDTTEAVISSSNSDSKQDLPTKESLGFLKTLGNKFGRRNSSTQDTIPNSAASLESPLPSDSENRDLDEVLETTQESEDDQHVQAEIESWNGIESPTPEIQDNGSTTSGAMKEVVDLLDDDHSQARDVDLYQSQGQQSMQSPPRVKSLGGDVNEDDEMLLPGNSSPRSPGFLSSSESISQGSEAQDCAPLPESQPLRPIEQDSATPVSELSRPRGMLNGHERKRKHEDGEFSGRQAQQPRLDHPATSQQNVDADKPSGRKRSRSESEAADKRTVQHNYPEYQSTERMGTPEQFANESKRKARKRSSSEAGDKQERRKRRRAEESNVAPKLVENTSGASKGHQDHHKSHGVESNAAPPSSVPDTSYQYVVQQEQRKSPRGTKRATANTSVEAAASPIVAKEERRNSRHGEQRATTSEFFRDPSDAAVVGQHSAKTPKTSKRIPRFVTDQEA